MRAFNCINLQFSLPSWWKHCVARSCRCPIGFALLFSQYYSSKYLDQGKLSLGASVLHTCTVTKLFRYPRILRLMWACSTFDRSSYILGSAVVVTCFSVAGSERVWVCVYVGLGWTRGRIESGPLDELRWRILISNFFLWPFPASICIIIESIGLVCYFGELVGVGSVNSSYIIGVHDKFGKLKINVILMRAGG